MVVKISRYYIISEWNIFQVHKCIVNFNIRISRKYIMNNVIQNEYYLNNYKSKKRSY